MEDINITPRDRWNYKILSPYRVTDDYSHLAFNLIALGDGAINKPVSVIPVTEYADILATNQLKDMLNYIETTYLAMLLSYPNVPAMYTGPYTNLYNALRLMVNSNSVYIGFDANSLIFLPFSNNDMLAIKGILQDRPF